MTRKIYVAMAETKNSDRIFGSAYTTYEAAIVAAAEMVEEVNANTDWESVPVVEDIDLIEE